MPFTPSQQQAIDSRSRELLVSAAAGSGKTSVLVERILQLVQKDRLSIDRMLIVTFTRAAAGEMRDRLEKQLSKLSGEDPFLRRQADLVSAAQISTIHSFCQKTVRRYFQFCQIDPQFGLCDERTRSAFYNESMEETLDWLYQSAKEDADLAALTARYQEREIVGILGELYRFLISRPDPMEWLEQQAQNDWNDETFYTQPAAQVFCQEAGFVAGAMMELCARARAMMDLPDFPSKLAATVLDDADLVSRVYQACRQGLDVLIETAPNIRFSRFPLFRKAQGDELVIIENFRVLRDRYKEMLKTIVKLLPESPQQAAQDLRDMAPATRGLSRTMQFFHHNFQQRKRDQAVIDFNDLEHMTLSILRQPQLQQEMCRQFDAIFVDEYQDVSNLQEAILNGLKRTDGARQYAFYVGDVKQSIYRFRQAEPGLFLGKLNRFSPQPDAAERRISLNQNFRSKTAVLDAVNRVFDHVMDSRVTEIDYDDDARLYPGLPSVNDPMPELHVFDNEETTPREQIENEARWIARDIQRTVHQPTVNADGTPGPALAYRDIAILLPVSKNVADVVEKILSDMGVPVYCEGSGDPMQSEEMMLMVQYLSLMDNLMNDIALLSVLRSPLFDMSEQELADIRLLKPEKDASFLSALLHAAEHAPARLRQRCQQVNELLVNERFLLHSSPMSDYLWQFLGRSGLYAHYGAQPGGKLRQANLRMLCHRAADWEQSHMDGLHGFVESLKLDGGSAETGPAVLSPGEDVVRVMTIHKSKGLEFPTVYVMNLGRSMFARPASKALSVRGDVGLGLGYVNPDMRTRRGTLVTSAVALREKNAERAERARVLYVALTRPKSRLVMVGSAPYEAACLARLDQRLAEGTDVYAVREAGTMLEWILQCVQPNDEREEFSTTGEWVTAKPMDLSTLSTGYPHKYTPWHVVFHSGDECCGQQQAKKHIQSIALSMENDVENVRFAPRYTPRALPMKVGVTALCRAMEQGADVENDEETPDTKRLPYLQAQPKLLASVPQLPAFLAPPREEHALQQGIQTHRLLGLMDLDVIRGYASTPKAIYAAVCAECDRLLREGILTEAESQSVNRSMAARFLQSDLGRRMLASARVEREWSFNLRVTEPFETLVQGVIDLCFLEDGQWVLVDFKTDRVDTAEELLARYAPQVDFYRRALEQGTPYAVKEGVLFSLRIGEGVGAPTP